MSGLMKKQTMRLAAVLILIGIVTSILISQWFLIIPAFVAVNMLQFSYTKFCPAEKIFKW